MAAELENPRARTAVQWLLRGGLILAVMLMGAGLVVRLAAGETAAPALPLGKLASPDVPPSDWLMGLGVLVLGLTPGMRVLTLLAVWTKERDWRFVGVALVVAVLLTVALAVGGG